MLLTALLITLVTVFAAAAGAAATDFATLLTVLATVTWDPELEVVVFAADEVVFDGAGVLTFAVDVLVLTDALLLDELELLDDDLLDDDPPLLYALNGLVNNANAALLDAELDPPDDELDFVDATLD